MKIRGYRWRRSWVRQHSVLPIRSHGQAPFLVPSENEGQLLPKDPQVSFNLTVFSPEFRHKTGTVYKLLPLLRGHLTAGEQRDSIQKIESLR